MDGPFDDALEIAKSIDMRIARGLVSEDEFSEKPFLGIPFTTKDNTAVKGKQHTLGLLSRRGLIAKDDSECVRLIKEAGGIILATTNIPELNRWQETRNYIIGQTNNPYDTRRTTGGSSGGEGAAIASCSTAFGLGTDIGGSIRMPAFYCGIYGHMPTNGVVNTRGCSLRTGKEESTMVVAGPMTRYATDLKPLLKVLAGPKNVTNLKLDESVNVKKLRYFYIPQSGDLRTSPVSSDLQDTMTKVINHFANICNEPVTEVKLSGTQYSNRMWRYWMTQEPGNFMNILGNGTVIRPVKELFKKIIGTSSFTLASVYTFIDTLLPKESGSKMRALTRKCEEELEEILGDDGVLFYHSTPRPAPFHYTAFFKIYNFGYWSFFNVLRVPVTQVPLGINAKGQPLGIQVIATKHRDRHCLAVAEELERAMISWVPPFEVKK